MGFHDDFDKNLGSIKMSVLVFQGRNDIKAYLEQEKKVDLIFDCHNYLEEKKIKFIVVEFINYVIIWWDQLVLSKRKNHKLLELLIMRMRFVPSHYYWNLYHKLKIITQGSNSVEDNHKKMEVLMIQMNTMDERKTTMARFLNGLNREMVNVVVLQHYKVKRHGVYDYKVEQQLNSKGST